MAANNIFFADFMIFAPFDRSWVILKLPRQIV